MTSIVFDDFTLAEGSTLIEAFCNGQSLTMAQSTQSEVFLRADWKTFFSSRAVRSFALVFEITLPLASTLPEGMMQRFAFAGLLPKGGALAITHGEETVTFADAVPVDCKVQGNGLSNHVTLTFEAINPDIAPELRAQFESGEIQEFETGSFD